MANIDTELSTIATAVYGSEMRVAIHDAIDKVNNDIPAGQTIPTFAHTTQTVSGEVMSGADTLYLYSIVFHAITESSSGKQINTVDAVISTVSGRSGYPLEPGVEDAGVVVCDIPGGFYCPYGFDIPVVPMGNAGTDLPHLHFNHTDQKIYFVYGFSEILGDTTNVMSHGTYFTY